MDWMILYYYLCPVFNVDAVLTIRYKWTRDISFNPAPGLINTLIAMSLGQGVKPGQVLYPGKSSHSRGDDFFVIRPRLGPVVAHIPSGNQRPSNAGAQTSYTMVEA